MSLTDQQWCPTSVQVTALQARGLRVKGKSGTNDAYAVLQVGKEKFQTSVVEKSVTPVWKEEATFDLPQLLRGGGGGGSERSTLQVQVLHRALVGPDKLLGQAVINLPQLSEDTTRNKTEWFRLLDKQGKPDKDRGEVLLDIQFMRNNMTASMFDLSAAGKSRSRLGKLKDKVRGKKKELDSSSGLAPSLTQVMTDSEEEANGDGEEVAKKDGKSKKLKMKSLFSSKTNLQKTMSQSMSVLPVKNPSLSGSQSSGLNIDPTEGKKKFKFKIHKRSGSSDSKDLSLGNQKHSSVEQTNMCINGSHVYCEEPQPRTSRAGSNFSLASSGHGSMEDAPDTSSPSLDSLRAVRQYSPWMEEEEEDEEKGENNQEIENQQSREDVAKMEEERRRKEEEEILKRQEELKMIIQRKEEKLAEEEKIKEELQRLAEEKRLEKQEQKKLEEEEKRREEEKIKKEEERKAHEEEERQREEELKLAEKMRMEEERCEELRRQKEEEERIEEMRRKEEEMTRRQKELEEMRAEQEKAESEQEERRKEEEEILRRQEEERMRKEEDMQKEYERRKREEEMKKKEEEEKAKKQKEAEEMKRQQEERKRKEEEEMLRKREELEKERLRLEEEERKAEEERLKREKEERIRLEEEIQREEEEKQQREKIRKEEERRLKELERLRQEEEEKMRQEEQEMRRIKEKMRQEEEAERARKEMEENERLAQLRRLEEQEKRQIEEEEKSRDKLRKEEEERKLKEENLANELRAAELISNPFDEDFSLNPFEDDPNFSSEAQSHTVKGETVKQRCDPALVSENSHIVSSDEMDPIRSQREKRKAPPPPESGQDGRQMQKAQDVAELQMNKQNLDSDGKTVNFVSQCSTTIPPQNKSLTDLKNTQSSTPTSELNDKRPAPSRPQPVAKDSSELKKIKSARNIPHMGSTAKEQVLPIPCSNPFENENELSDQKDSSASGPVCWPPASTQKADRDAASQVKLKSSKMAPAPVPPAKKDANGGEKIINKGLKDANDQQESTGHLHVNNGPNSDSQRIKTSEKPPSSRRLLPVKPLNPSDQPFTSLFQEDAKSPGIGCELQTKNKVPDTVMTGPFSQLTREELVCLVLKQETHLLEKQSKISELEQYIDNLLVRVIEEQPSILMSLSAAPKKVA
uniref:RAB11 family interacting protein 1 (class I) b n=1 Tax=Oryzias latipes TaxID=8090 RepID=A0A3P9H519_ORYLA